MNDKQRRLIEEQQRAMRAMGVDRPEQYRPVIDDHRGSRRVLVEPTEASKAFEQMFECNGEEWTIDDILRREG